MRVRFSAIIVGFLTFTSFATAGEAQAPRALAGKPKLPGQGMWFLPALEESFTIVGGKYDAKARQMVWELEAKKQVACSGYHAVFVDADKVQWADLPLTLAPSRKTYEKGAHVRAALPLPPADDFEEVTTVNILPRK